MWWKACFQKPCVPKEDIIHEKAFHRPFPQALPLTVYCWVVAFILHYSHWWGVSPRFLPEFSLPSQGVWLFESQRIQGLSYFLVPWTQWLEVPRSSLLKDFSNESTMFMAFGHYWIWCLNMLSGENLPLPLHSPFPSSSYCQVWRGEVCAQLLALHVSRPDLQGFLLVWGVFT